MNDLKGLSKSQIWTHASYHSREAREFIHWIDRTYGPMGELLQAMHTHGIPRELVMHSEVLRAFDQCLHIVDAVLTPPLSKYLPAKFSHLVILGIKVNTDDKLSCPVSPGRIVLDSIERYGVNEIPRPSPE